MLRQFLVALVFALSADIFRRLIPVDGIWLFLSGAVWGIAMWEAIAFTGRVEAKRRQVPRSIDPSF